MRDSAIRHLAACDRSSLIAAALFESTVQIWSLDSSQQIAEFETILDFGGQRLVLAADGKICITGSWSAGLAAYSVPDGRRLWHLPNSERFNFSPWTHPEKGCTVVSKASLWRWLMSRQELSKTQLGAR